MTKENEKEKEKEESVDSSVNEDFSKQDYAKEVSLRHSFYKDGYLKSLGIVFLTLLTFGMTIYWSAHMYLYEPPVKYVPVNAEGKILADIPENQPIMSEDQLKQWTFDAMEDIFSYNYYTIDSHGSKARKYFSEQSFPDFMENFRNSSDIVRVRNNNFIVDVRPSMPEVVQRGQLNNGALYWRFDITLRRVFVNHRGIIREEDDFIINVVRSNSSEARDGVLIYNIRNKAQTEQE